MASVNFATRIKLLPPEARILAWPIPGLVAVAYIIVCFLFGSMVDHGSEIILGPLVASLPVLFFVGLVASIVMTTLAWIKVHHGSICDPCVHCGYDAGPVTASIPTTICSECGHPRCGPIRPPVRWRVFVTIVHVAEAIVLAALFVLIVYIEPAMYS